MDVLRAIKERRSIRKFTEKEVEEEKLNTALDAARWAPSSKNSQPWEFIVIKDADTLQKIAKEAAVSSRFWVPQVVLVGAARQRKAVGQSRK